MRISLIILTALFAGFVTLSSADYSDLEKRYETYQPPKFAEFDNETSGPEPVSGKNTSSPVGEINRIVKGLLSEHEQRLADNPALDFLVPYCAELLEEIKGIAKDSKVVSERLKNRFALEDIEILAALRNPLILAAQRKVSSEIQSFTQVQDLEMVLKQFTAFTEAIDTKVGPLKMTESARLKRNYPNVGALKAQVVDHQVTLLTHKLSLESRDVITNTRKAFWRYVYTASAIDITKETIDALHRLGNVATSLYRSGKTSFQDVIKINIRISLLAEQLVSLQRQQQTIRVDLLTLLDLPRDTGFGDLVLPAGSQLPGAPQELIAFAHTDSQELNMLREQIQKTQKMIQMAETMILPDYTFNFAVNDDKAVQSTGSERQRPAFSQKIMASMSNGLPARPWYGIDSPWLAGTREQLKSLQYRLADQENQTARQIEDNWFKADKANREYNLFANQILALSESALKVSTSEYESGAIPFSQAIGSYMEWLQVRLDIAKKKTDVEIFKAQLGQAAGRSL